MPLVSAQMVQADNWILHKASRQINDDRFKIVSIQGLNDHTSLNPVLPELQGGVAFGCKPVVFFIINYFH